MAHEVERKFALVSGNTAGGATRNSTADPGVAPIVLYRSYDQALHAARATIDGYKGYNWVVIYEACTVVSRSKAPIVVVDIDSVL